VKLVQSQRLAVARLTPLRDLRRCATYAAARLTPLRDLKLLVMLVLLMFYSIPAQSQFTFNFGSSSTVLRANVPAVVVKALQSSYYVTVEIDGFVFDGGLQYSTQLCPYPFVLNQYQITQNTGFYHARTFGQAHNPVGDVAGIFSPLIGAGVYKITFDNHVVQPITITLDLTDANWGLGTDNVFRNILLEPDFSVSPTEVLVWISDEDKAQNTMDN
jgi:hypothetical protein